MNRLFNAVGLALCLALTGCGGAGIIGSQNPEVRAFNAVDGQSSITVSLADAGGKVGATTSPAAYANLSNGPNAIVRDTSWTCSIIAEGTTLFTNQAQLFQINDRYTVYAGGNSGGYFALPLRDNRSGVATGNFALRLVHAAANDRSDAFDFYIASGSSASGGTSILSGVAFGAASSTANSSTADPDGYVKQALPTGQLSGTYTVYVTTHGSKNSLASATLTLEDRTHYTAVAYDNGRVIGLTIHSDR